MSIFSQISEALGSQTGGQSGSNHSDMVKAALDMFGHPAGMSNLGQGFEGAGLGHIFQSWVGTGANNPVSPQQVESAIGSDRIQQLARIVHGTPPERTRSANARMRAGELASNPDEV